jgi:hypothetical protein
LASAIMTYGVIVRHVAGTFAAGYGVAVLIIGRQNRNRRAHLRNRLR